MPYRLIKYGLSKKHPEPRMFRSPRGSRTSYDVVIIGAAGTGWRRRTTWRATTASRDVAVLEKGYIGGGNTGRNTAIIRSNYLTPEGVKFYDESVRLFQDLSRDLDLNLFYSERGHFTLAHTDADAAHHALAGRGQQAPRRRQRGRRTRGRQGSLSRRST